jgi:hypothetical protein
MADRFVTRCGCKVSGDLCAVYPGDSRFLEDVPMERCKHGWDHTIYVADTHDIGDGVAAVYRDVQWKPPPGTEARARYDKAHP